jgi:hypothetical protein
MLENFDFMKARKMAGLSLRYRKDKSFIELLKDNYDKCEWFYNNSETVLSNVEITSNRNQ